MSDTMKQPEGLDRWTDYIKDLFGVTFAVVGSFYALISENELFLPWALWLVGGSIGYILFLTYKRATLIQGEWGIVARVRAIRTISSAIPLWILITITFVYDESLAQIIPNFIERLDELSMAQVLFPLLFGAVTIGVIIFGVVWKKIPNLLKYEEKVMKKLSKYIGSEWAFQSGLTILLVFYSTSFIAAGWYETAVQEIRVHYFTSGFVLVMILLVFGAFSTWYNPCRCKYQYRPHLEVFTGLLVLVSIENVYFVSAFLLVVLAILYWKTTQYPVVDIDTCLIEAEKREKDSFHLVFYKNHPRIGGVTMLVIMTAWLGTSLAYLYLGLHWGWFVVMFILGLALFGIVPFLWIKYSKK